MNDLSKTCVELIKRLQSNSNSMKELNKKAIEVENFCSMLETNPMRISEFKKSEFVKDTLISAFDFSIIAVNKNNLPHQVDSAIVRLIKCYDSYGITLSTEDNLESFRNMMIHIASLEVTKAENDKWGFWLQIFTELFHLSFFYNCFQSTKDRDSLYMLVLNLLNFGKLFTESGVNQRSLVLKMFMTFLETSPYPPNSSLIENFFYKSKDFVDCELNDNDFATFLAILTRIIPLAPTYYVIKSSINTPPFQDNIFLTLFKRWKHYVKHTNLRKYASAFMLEFITIMDSMQLKISNDFIQKWSRKLLQGWDSVKRRPAILGPSDIPVFHADVEILSRNIPNDESISKSLVECFIVDGKMNLSSDLIFLFIAIAKYDKKGIITNEHWKLILKKISTFGMMSSTFLEAKILVNLCNLLESIVKLVDDYDAWGAIFTYFMENIDKNPTEEYSHVLLNVVKVILMNQKIRTEVAHQKQKIFWNCKSTTELFTFDRLRCIHAFIYYYGFASDEHRAACMNSLIILISVVEKSKMTDYVYLKQLGLTICSIVLSHACELLPEPKEEKEETIDDVCAKISSIFSEMKISNATKEPLQTNKNFLVSAESSQITSDDSQFIDTPVINMPKVEEKEVQPETSTFALCNFISTKIQQAYVDTINEQQNKCKFIYLFIKLALSSFAPDLFSISSFLSALSRSFIEKSKLSNFTKYVHLFLSVAEMTEADFFQPFFEEIEAVFFQLVKQYLDSCKNQISSFISRNTTDSWDELENIYNENFLIELPSLAEFAVKCSRMAPEFADKFIEPFLDLLTMTHHIPLLHQPICKHLIALPMSEPQTTQVIDSVCYVVDRVLNHLLVPIKSRSFFVCQILDDLSPVLEDGMLDELLKIISKYQLTNNMKYKILELMTEHFKKAPSIFTSFWNEDDSDNDVDPFFILDPTPMIRLTANDSFVAVLNQLPITIEGGKLDKYEMYDFIIPSIQGCFEEADVFKEHVYTGLSCIMKIAAMVPELTLKCLNFVFETFTQKKLSLFTPACLNVLFSGLSDRVHFSEFLRQFIPLLVVHISKYICDDESEDMLEKFPYELFFFEDQKIPHREATKQFCKLSAPYMISYAIKTKNQKVLDFYAENLSIDIKEIMHENSIYIASFLLASNFMNDESEEKQDYLAIYKKFASLLPDGEFESPLPLLSFVSITNEQPIIDAYSYILRINHTPTFIDFRSNIFALYAKIYTSQHPLTQSFYRQQFTLYVQILFKFHKKEFEAAYTLYLDLLEISVNMIDFSPKSEINKLFNLLMEIPSSINVHATGLCQSLENICLKTNNKHPLVEAFIDKFPNLLSKMQLIPMLEEEQLQHRTLYGEFKRIAKSKTVNELSINFMIKQLAQEQGNSENIKLIDSSPRDLKRSMMNTVYDYSMKAKYPLALLLYSELYLRFFDIHPSPSIIACDSKSSYFMFKQLIMYTRDKNPELSQAALKALREIVNRNEILENFLPGDAKTSYNKKLLVEIYQYSNYTPHNSSKKLDTSEQPWISQFVCSLISKMTDEYLCSHLGKCAALSPQFAPQIFPHLFIESHNSRVLRETIDIAFMKFAEDPLKYQTECRLFLKAYAHLKNIWFSPDTKHTDPQWHLKWYNYQIDFQKAAKVCLAVGDPYSAYLYSEFAHECNPSIRDDVLKDIFMQLNETDLLYGLNTEVSDYSAVAMLHQQENRMSRALVLFDNAGNNAAMCEALKALHLYNFLNQLKNESIDSLWRLQKWDVSSQQAREMARGEHSTNIFLAMQAFATRNEAAVAHQLKSFFDTFHLDLKSPISKQLSNILDASALLWFESVLFHDQSRLFQLFPRNVIGMYQNSITKLNKLSKTSFKITENPNALHGIFFCITQGIPSGIQPATPTKFFSEVISNARDNGEIESAQYFISLLRKCQPLSQYADFEQIQLLFHDNPHHAVSLLEKNLNNMFLKNGQINSERRTQSFNLRVKLVSSTWAAQTHYLTSKEVTESLKKVIEEATDINTEAILAEAHFTLAKFYHNDHRRICNHLTSPEFATINNIIESEEAQLSQMANARQTKDIREKANNLNYYKNIVEQQRRDFSDTIMFAMEHYMLTLAHTDKHDTEALFSLVGLWFNYSFAKYKEFVQEVPDLIVMMNEHLCEIKPEKFLPLFYQLAARIDNSSEAEATQGQDYSNQFQQFMRILVSQITKVSPHSCIPVLYALCHNDVIFNQEMIGGTFDVNKDKIDAVKDLVTSIRSESESLNDIWTQLNDLLDTYVRLAQGPQGPKNTKQQLSLYEKGFFKFTQSLNPQANIITASNIVGISKFFDELNILCGITSPVMIRVLGTDGKIYKQIIKGHKDDLRQDAVMQQLFLLSSTLLSQKNPSLSVRSYKVIPLTPTSGVIEFVEGTQAIHEYLFKIGDDNCCAHARYYPNDTMSYEQANHMFTTISKNYHATPRRSRDPTNLLNCYFKITKEFKPVFRFFFIENFQNTGDWFTCRMRYARHTATNSMIGYIFGIGDRHLNNILIDKSTGEVIHIDLGIAFDQGKSLPISELVPFRLTPEIVDGMGWKGKEGVFRRACEESLHVLRENSDHLLTVLEVFISDPIYNWNIVPKKQTAITKFRPLNQTKPSYGKEAKHKYAESVMVTCRRKLEGREMGEALSIEGQVSKLIADASAPEQLCMMFAGWRPWL